LTLQAACMQNQAIPAQALFLKKDCSRFILLCETLPFSRDSRCSLLRDPEHDQSAWGCHWVGMLGASPQTPGIFRFGPSTGSAVVLTAVGISGDSLRPQPMPITDNRVTPRSATNLHLTAADPLTRYNAPKSRVAK
jgi:hypothetical protein